MQRFPDVLASIGSEISTPAPIMLIDVVDENIRRMQAFADAHGKGLRPHVKTHKSVEIGHRQLAAGAAGLTVGTLGEAEVFAEAGCDDIFLAYPLWPAGSKARRLRDLTRRARMSVGVESGEAVEQVADAMGEDVERLGVLVEIDCGARRSGVHPEQAGHLAARAGARGLDVRGVFTYPGHGGTAGAREAAARDQARALRAAVASLSDHGIDAEVVSAGSTPTAEFSTDPVITELRPGEYVFNDHDNYRLGDCDATSIGLFVASTVVSDQGHEHVVVDAGTKVLGREGNPERGYGQVPEVDGVLERLNEYHGFLRIGEPERRPGVGRQVAVVPHHVCPVVNSFAELVVVGSDGRLLGRWPVDAQGHT